MKTLVKLLKRLSRYISHGLVFGIPVIAVWGAIFPWPPAERSLSGLPKIAHFFVGMKVNYAPSSTGIARTESRSYLIFPSYLGWPKIVTVSQMDQAAPKMSNPSLLGFFVLLGSYAFALRVVWRSWFGRKNVQNHLTATTKTQTAMTPP